MRDRGGGGGGVKRGRDSRTILGFSFFTACVRARARSFPVLHIVRWMNLWRKNYSQKVCRFRHFGTFDFLFPVYPHTRTDNILWPLFHVALLISSRSSRPIDLYTIWICFRWFSFASIIRPNEVKTGNRRSVRARARSNNDCMLTEPILLLRFYQCEHLIIFKYYTVGICKMYFSETIRCWSILVQWIYRIGNG